MAVTAEGLYLAASLDPTQFDEDIISPELDEAGQKAALIAHINTSILPGAKSEVSIPFRRVTGYGMVADFVNNHTRFALLSSDEKSALIAEGEPLYDLAVVSYGRSELEKQVDTDAAEYDKDSAENRVQGNNRLQKLLDWATDVISGGASGSSDVPRSSIATARVSWA
jgi:hypothetical protein